MHEALEAGYSDSGYERNALFANRGDGTFAEVGFALGVDSIHDGCSFVAFDYDRDGDLDLFLRNADPLHAGSPWLQLLRNHAGEGPHRNSLIVELRGLRPNTRAIGARIVAEGGGVRWIRELGVGSGYLGQNGYEIHFGLGSVDRLDRLTVRWPDGSEREFAGIPARSRVILDQETGGIDLRALRE